MQSKVPTQSLAMKQRERGGEHPALSNDPEKEETGKEENEMGCLLGWEQQCRRPLSPWGGGLGVQLGAVKVLQFCSIIH